MAAPQFCRNCGVITFILLKEFSNESVHKTASSHKNLLSTPRLPRFEFGLHDESCRELNALPSIMACAVALPVVMADLSAVQS